MIQALRQHLRIRRNSADGVACPRRLSAGMHASLGQHAHANGGTGMPPGVRNSLGMTTLCVWAVLLVGVTAARAEQAAAPAPAPAPAAPAAAPAAPKITAVVKTLEGAVETRPAVGQPWTPVKAGMQLAEGADLRTGFRARCVLDMTDSQVQVGPLTVVRIGELRQDGDRIRTRLFMKVGTTQAEVVKKQVASDFAIVTPSATLSVRGTNGIRCTFFPDLGGQFGLTQSGLIQVTDSSLGTSTGVRPGEGTNDQATPPTQVLAVTHQPPVLDLFGLTSAEKWAAMRWNTSTAVPVGLNGPTGSPILNVLQTKPSECSDRIKLNPTGDEGHPRY